MNSKNPRARQRRAARPSRPLGEHIAEFQKNLSRRFKEGQRQQALRAQRRQKMTVNPAAEQQWVALRKAMQFTWLQRRFQRRQLNQRPRMNIAGLLWPRTTETLTSRDAAAKVMRTGVTALLLMTLIILVISAVPLRITTANWYLEVLASIGESIPVLVFASIFAILSLTLDSDGKSSSAYRSKLNRISRLGYILALLLLPLQIGMMAWLFGDAFNTNRIQRNAIASNAETMIAGAQQTASSEQFVAYLRSRNLNANLESIAAAPLAQVKTEFVRSVKVQQQRQEEGLNAATRESLLRYTANGLRLFVSLVILAAFLRGFQALVRRCSSEKPSAEELPGQLGQNPTIANS